MMAGQAPFSSGTTPVAAVNKTKAERVQALRDTVPPAVDPMTYLTVIDDYLSADVLDDFNQILEDRELTQQIGWDLVGKLVALDGSEQCLGTVARLGNPRELIIGILEALGALCEEETRWQEEQNAGVNEEDEAEEHAEQGSVTEDEEEGREAVMKKSIETEDNAGKMGKNEKEDKDNGDDAGNDDNQENKLSRDMEFREMCHDNSLADFDPDLDESVAGATLEMNSQRKTQWERSQRWLQQRQQGLPRGLRQRREQLQHQMLGRVPSTQQDAEADADADTALSPSFSSFSSSSSSSSSFSLSSSGYHQKPQRRRRRLREDKFISLVGMLGIVHKRLRARQPSRFLASSLSAVLRAYVADGPHTFAVINLVAALSGGLARPLLPSRSSPSVVMATTNHPIDYESRTAPDPEAEVKSGHSAVEDPAERNRMTRLLLAFVTEIIDLCAHGADFEWSARLWEFYTRDRKQPPGRESLLEKWKMSEEHRAKDDLMGQLVALTRDLGLKFDERLVQNISSDPSMLCPFYLVEDADLNEETPLSCFGLVCILGYMSFSSTVFGADHGPLPDMQLFPHHANMLNWFADCHHGFGEFAVNAPGVLDAMMAVGWRLKHERNVCHSSVNPNGDANSHSGWPWTTTCLIDYLGAQLAIAATKDVAVDGRVLSAGVRTVMLAFAGELYRSIPDYSDQLTVVVELLTAPRWLEWCCDSARAVILMWFRELLIAIVSKERDVPILRDSISPALQLALFPVMSRRLSPPSATGPRDCCRTTHESTGKESTSSADRHLNRYSMDASDKKQQQQQAAARFWAEWSAWRLSHHRTANLACLLFAGPRFAPALPPSMARTALQNYIAPLLDAADGFLEALHAEALPPHVFFAGANDMDRAKLDVEILVERLRVARDRRMSFEDENGSGR